MAKILSLLMSLLAACTARGTWYWWSSTTNLILRPWMPFSLASSKRMRMPSVEPMPQALTGPLSAVWLPMTISVAVTPSSASAGAASTPANSAAGASLGGFLMWISLGSLVARRNIHLVVDLPLFLPFTGHPVKPKPSRPTPLPVWGEGRGEGQR